MDEAKKQGQISKEVDKLEDATATLVKKIAELETSLAPVCNQAAPIEIKSEITAAEDGSKAALAQTLDVFSERVASVVGQIISIVDRLEL